jgi:hypothetical protein
MVNILAPKLNIRFNLQTAGFKLKDLILSCKLLQKTKTNEKSQKGCNSLLKLVDVSNAILRL